MIKKSKIDRVEEMIFDVVFNNKLPVKTVLMDSWYGNQRLMVLIDNERNNHRFFFEI
ncbi:MAG: hypothetical protein SWX82_22880 [Cyanobacteriota bacterium]|nr:hypothetical protein [Cyanobacteriota bacterium]